MFGQLLPEQASAPDSATVYGFAGPMTGTLPPLLPINSCQISDMPSMDPNGDAADITGWARTHAHVAEAVSRRRNVVQANN